MARPIKKQIVRKLPDYEVLKAEYLSGLSYTQIAEKYDYSNKSGVFHTLKRRAIAYGEWPLPAPARSMPEKVSAHNSTRLIDIGFTWELVEEYLAANDMTLGDLANATGLRRGTLGDWRRKHRLGMRLRVHTKSAVILMRAIGEPLPKWLRRRAARQR